MNTGQPNTYKGTGGASNITCSAALNILAYKTQCEPVTVEWAPNSGEGFSVWNSSGIPVGGTRPYKIAVWPDSVPDSRIIWHATGGVSFMGGNTGRSVTVRGDAEGFFTLEAEIEGITEGTQNTKIQGRVMESEPEPVKVTVWIVCDDYGGNAACTINDVENVISSANATFAQSVMPLATLGGIHYTNRMEWLDLVFTNGTFQGSKALRDICSDTGGIELYFVRNLVNSDARAIHTRDGIIISTGGGYTSRTVSHEVGHACGLEDIYESSEDGTIIIGDDAIKIEWMPQDWGNGHYPPEMEQRQLISRLLMYGFDLDDSVDIPLGDLYGVGYTRIEGQFEGDIAIEYWEKRLVPVGLSSMNRNPSHE